MCGGPFGLMQKKLMEIVIVLPALACVGALSGCRDGAPAGTSPAASRPVHYACAAHPLVVSREDGACSECGAALVAQKSVGTYLCIDHFESAGVLPGACGKCGKLLVAIPNVNMWKCTRHPEVMLEGGSACPVCESKLVEVMVGKVWVCTRSLEETLGEEGASGLTALRLQGNGLGFNTEELGFGEGDCSKCGRELLGVTVQVPHGDHNPRHGGVFRMAPDNWHHLEVVAPREGLLRVYFFDNYTRPLEASGFSARYLRATFDEKDGFVDGAEAFELKPAAAGYLEAAVPGFSFPLHLVIKVVLGGKEERFDFTLRKLGSAGAEAPPPRPRRPEDSLVIPVSAAGIVSELSSRDERVRALLREQDYKRLFLPAFEAKALALALEKKMAPGEAADRKRGLGRAVKEVVRGAWLLDHFGDQGDRTEVLQQYDVFSSGVKALKALYPAPSAGD